MPFSAISRLGEIMPAEMRTGAQLRAAREAAGLTRPKLAAMAGLHPNAVKYWERPGKAVTSRDYAPRLIAQVLGVTLGERSRRPAPLMPQLYRGEDNSRQDYARAGAVRGEAAETDNSPTNTHAGARAVRGDIETLANVNLTDASRSEAVLLRNTRARVGLSWRGSRAGAQASRADSATDNSAMPKKARARAAWGETPNHKITHSLRTCPERPHLARCSACVDVCSLRAERGQDDAGRALPKAERPFCGARTRAGGSCRARVVPGKRRCRMHGGLSTGAKTAEGRARIAEAQRRRWRKVKAEAGE